MTNLLMYMVWSPFCRKSTIHFPRSTTNLLLVQTRSLPLTSNNSLRERFQTISQTLSAVGWPLWPLTHQGTAVCIKWIGRFKQLTLKFYQCTCTFIQYVNVLLIQCMHVSLWMYSAKHWEVWFFLMIGDEELCNKPLSFIIINPHPQCRLKKGDIV